MQSRAIPDSSITASSVYSSKYPPLLARLHVKAGGGNPKGAWAAKVNRFGEWIQVDIGKMTEVTGVATQGRQDADEWVRSYILLFSHDGSTFTNYLAGKSFAGNNDRDTVVKHDLKPPVIARYIRLVPKTWYVWISLRMELYGCK